MSIPRYTKNNVWNAHGRMSIPRSTKNNEWSAHGRMSIPRSTKNNTWKRLPHQHLIARYCSTLNLVMAPTDRQMHSTQNIIAGNKIAE